MSLAPPRLALTFLALSLAACSDARPSPDEVESSPGEVEGTADAAPMATARDGGRNVDAGSEVQAPTPVSRDAGVDTGAAQAPEQAVRSDASLGASAADSGGGRDGGRDATVAGDDAGVDTEPPRLTPAFHIPLRVHRADSGLSDALLVEILEEVNQIWWKQAGICFEAEVVRTEEVRKDGFDFWFHRSRLGCNANANGVYCGDHDIHSLDAPSLSRADNAAWNVRRGPARTTAHELGHGLNLDHFNGFVDSNDSLMSSGRQGFKLHEAETTTARKRAQEKALANSPATPCATAKVVD